jgi:hypothetical protein
MIEENRREEMGERSDFRERERERERERGTRGEREGSILSIERERRKETTICVVL